MHTLTYVYAQFSMQGAHVISFVNEKNISINAYAYAYTVCIHWLMYAHTYMRAQFSMQGAHVISFVNETYSYTILDVCSKVAFTVSAYCRILRLCSNVHVTIWVAHSWMRSTSMYIHPWCLLQGCFHSKYIWSNSESVLYCSCHNLSPSFVKETYSYTVLDVCFHSKSSCDLPQSGSFIGQWDLFIYSYTVLDVCS
jgi:hypothetical protein